MTRPSPHHDVGSDPNWTTPFNRAWRSGLLAGFFVLLLLILFVTGIGYREMVAAQSRLRLITDQHMKKLELTKIMHMTARNRTLLMHKMILMQDPFARDEANMVFTDYGARFGEARKQLLKLDLTPAERAQLAEQGRLTGMAVPIQRQVVDLVYDDRLEEAQKLLLEQAIPAQDAVLEALSRLDQMSQKAALEASRQATREFEQARRWMLILSAAALGLAACRT